MRAGPPPPGSTRSPKTRPGRRVLPWVASVVLHASILALWSIVPTPTLEPTEDEAPTFHPVELVELGEPLTPVPRRSIDPPPDATPEPAEQPDPQEPRTDPRARPLAPADDRPTRPASADEPPDQPPDEPPETSDVPAPAQTSGDRTGALALRGLRGGSRPHEAPATGPVTRPSLPPPTSGSNSQGRVGGAQASVKTRTDGKPRSLAEAGFVQRRNGKMVYRDRRTGFVATLLPDGRVKFRQSAKPSAMPGLAEALIAASGQELYHNQKRKLLERTYELRLQMAVDFASDKIDRRLESLYRELLVLWSAGPSDDKSRQRVLLFDRWDECEEGMAVELPGFEDASSSELDQKRRDAGRAARRTIERFIGRQLPAGSEHAYTAEELRTLNGRRHSQARFAPYD